MGKSVCSWVRSVLAAHLDGELKVPADKAVRRHLEECEACRSHLRLLEQTWKTLDELPPPPPVAGGFTSRMMARVVEEKQLERLEAKLRPHRIRRRILAGAAGMAAGLGLGFFLFTCTGLQPAGPSSPVEQEVSRNLTLLDDADLVRNYDTLVALERRLAEEGL